MKKIETTKKPVKAEKSEKKIIKKPLVKKAEKPKKSVSTPISPGKGEEKYFEGVGRRKTAIARVRLFFDKEGGSLKKTSPSSLPLPVEISQDESESKKGASLPGTIDKTFVNGKSLEKYFPEKDLQEKVLAPLELMNCRDRFRVSIKIKGGGLTSQAEAARHGISRALILFNSDFRKKLKKIGYLKRDPRMRERKKFGLKRARKAPQWSKR